MGRGHSPLLGLVERESRGDLLGPPTTTWSIPVASVEP